MAEANIAMRESLRQLADCSLVTARALDEIETYWSPEEPPPTVAAGGLARALGRSFEEVTPDEAKQFFDTCELLIRSNNEQIATAIATGLLESLVTEIDAGRLSSHVIVPLLGPECHSYCTRWNQFCGVRTPGLDSKT